MTDLTSTPPSTTSPSQSPSTRTVRPVLITEKQVTLSTAAALAPAPTWRRPWSVVAVFAAARTRIEQLNKPVRPDYPKRYRFMEDALLSREMNRL